jgi:hypothetical protein
MSNVAQMQPRQLTMFEGWTIEMGQIAFAGTVEIPLSSASDVALIEALRLGRTVTLTVEVGGERVQFDAKVDQRAFGLKHDKELETDIPWTRCKLKVLDEDPTD